MDACPHKHLLVNISRALCNTAALVKGAKDGDNVHKNVCRVCSIETMEYNQAIKRTNTIQSSKGQQYGGIHHHMGQRCWVQEASHKKHTLSNSSHKKSKRQKLTETESRFLPARGCGAGRGAEPEHGGGWELTGPGFPSELMKCSETKCGAACSISVNVLKTTELYTLNGWI